MPIYEYRCLKCDTLFELIQKFSDDPIKKHAGCGGKVERLISAPGLHFKGSGFYITDYARGSSPGSVDNKGKSSKGSESKSTESKASDSGSGSSSASTSGGSGASEAKTSKPAESKPAKPAKN